MENKLKLSKNLLLDILFPKFIKKDKLTKNTLAKKTSIRVLKFKDQRFVIAAHIKIKMNPININNGNFLVFIVSLL